YCRPLCLVDRLPVAGLSGLCDSAFHPGWGSRQAGTCLGHPFRRAARARAVARGRLMAQPPLLGERVGRGAWGGIVLLGTVSAPTGPPCCSVSSGAEGLNAS